MKSAKKIFCAVSALTLVSLAYAQDFTDEFYDDYSSSYEDSTPTVTVGGSVELNARAYVEASDYSFVTKKNIKKIFDILYNQLTIKIL